jgi:hypothetical protein
LTGAVIPQQQIDTAKATINREIQSKEQFISSEFPDQWKSYRIPDVQGKPIASHGPAVAKPQPAAAEAQKLQAKTIEAEIRKTLADTLKAISQSGKNTAAAIYDGQKILADKIMPVPAESLLLSEYLTRTDGALDPSSDEFKNGYERFKRLYATKLTADMSKDVVSSDAATWAFSMATGGVAKTDYGSIVKPYGMRTDDLIKKLPDAIMSTAKAAGVALDDLDSYELDPRPDYNGQYYLIQANGEIVVNPKTSDPIIVKIK